MSYTEMKTRTKSETQTTEKKLNLSSTEEKVVRMLHGYSAPLSHKLELHGENFPDTQKILLDIEQQTLKAAQAHFNPTKSKIVHHLRNR